MLSADNSKIKMQNTKLQFKIQKLFLIILALPFLLVKIEVAVAPGGLPFTPPPKITTVIAVGDIMLSRQVASRIEKAQNPNLPFENSKDLLASADITFGNLECPLSPNPKAGGEGLVFRCPARFVEGLKTAGFDVLGTANNHALDQGLNGLNFTIDHLKSQEILPVGTTKCRCEECNDEATSFLNPKDCFANARNDNIIERNGVKFGFLAYSYSARNDGGRSAHPQISTMNELSILQSEISNLKLNGADIVIVSMHAGAEYTRKPNQAQIDFAHAAIDAGADIVIGHHPHWIQPIEVYPPISPSSPGEGRMAEGQERSKHRGLIFYSLGNFVFDQMWSQETQEGLTIKITIINNKIERVALVPIIIENYCCPRMANEEEKAKILQKINQNTNTIFLSER